MHSHTTTRLEQVNPDDFELPDGRRPIRYESSRRAVYEKLRGEGEVSYPLAMVRYIRKRPRHSKEELKEIARKRVELIRSKDPEHYKRAGAKGGKSKGGYRGSKNVSNS